MLVPRNIPLPLLFLSIGDPCRRMGSCTRFLDRRVGIVERPMQQDGNHRSPSRIFLLSPASDSCRICPVRKVLVLATCARPTRVGGWPSTCVAHPSMTSSFLCPHFLRSYNSPSIASFSRHIDAQSKDARFGIDGPGILGSDILLDPRTLSKPTRVDVGMYGDVQRTRITNASIVQQTTSTMPRWDGRYITFDTHAAK
mmetsp:Transcript_9725/g.59035  ORF Transcript_9725/g.59035 Transcript_9725/m.59035 type:complete len:198 (+) Transcript_9725:1620-2213(+)